MKNAFSINTVFLLLAIAGLALLPQLPVQLQPNRTGDQVHVTYAWPGMGANVLEKEVTSPIEGALAPIRGIEKITSESWKGRGDVTLTFKDGTDIDAARFEASSLMRSLHKELPAGVSLPMVTYNEKGEDDDPLMMVYTINGEGSSYELQQYVSQNIVPHISNIRDISRARVTGAPSREWEITYNKSRLNNAGLETEDLKSAIGNYLEKQELGATTRETNHNKETIHLAFSGMPGDSLNWDQIILEKSNNRLVQLSDVASARLREARRSSYFRVNGLNTVYLTIHSAKGANQVRLGENIRKTVERLSPGFPENFSMLVNYDASKNIREEITRISRRALLAIIVLLLFVLLISRRWRYLLIISLSLAANLSIAVVFFYFLGIEIHLYSLAGITVSLGMIIDNTIVMTDHLKHTGNRKAFMPILAATLTTIGALSIIFFLKEEQQLNLIDFAVVMLVNLAVSLAVALFFVPALMTRLPLSTRLSGRDIRRRKRVVAFSRIYEKFITFALRWRWAFIILFIWGFGIPVFLLPDEIETKEEVEPSWYVSFYNKTLGNNQFVSSFKPTINKVLGGSWYYFSNYFSSGAMNWDDGQTKLYARAEMPDGATIQQMNRVFRDFENFLSGFEEIKMFTSNIYGIDNAWIEVTFHKEEAGGTFPYALKNSLIAKANNTGGIDFYIYGVGRGFSNATHDGPKNNRIQFRGYNYDLMLEQAGVYKDSLLKHPRIQEVILQTGNSWRNKPRYEFVMDLNEKKLNEKGSSLSNVYHNLRHYSPAAMRAGSAPTKQGMAPVKIREENHDKASVWAFNNSLLASNTGFFRLKDVGTLTKQRTGEVIRKEDQEYRLNVEYDFIGPYELNKRVRERWLGRINESLPMGFSVIDRSGFGGWNREEKSQYWLLLIVAAIIFLLCGILLESLRQPLMVIAAVPVSFIGLFLTFALFRIEFDQGGYAAMILLCGLTVNAALYIINAFNNFDDRRSPVRRFLKAYNHKIIPVLLTTLSTILGLLPFLLAGKDEGFWFSLAAGATGGLIFSVLAVVVFLPVIMINSPIKDGLTQKNELDV